MSFLIGSFCAVAIGTWEYQSGQYVLPAIAAALLVIAMTWVDVVWIRREVAEMPLRVMLREVAKDVREGVPEASGFEPLAELSEKQTREGIPQKVLWPYVATRAGANLIPVGLGWAATHWFLWRFHMVGG